MQRKILPLTLALILGLCSTKSLSQSGNWQTIFNGKDLQGWTERGNFEKEIKDGTLYLKASHAFNNAWVLSEKTYRNFKLELEFLMDDGANSGVLFRYNPALNGALNALAYEANIDWDPNIQGPLGTIEHAARAKLIEGIDKMAWNKMRIEALGDHLKVFINESLVCETHNRRSMVGKIGLQVPIRKGGTIGFKNVRIQELDNTELSVPPIEDYYRATYERSLKPMMEGESLEGWHTIGPGKWSFEEGGVLHGYSGNAHSFLVTNDTYKNFYLKCKFKIIKEDNSGIFIRKHPDSTNVALTDAIECNIYDHNGYSHAYSTGSIVTHARAWYGMTHFEDWNTMEIFAHESYIVLYINGQKASEAHLEGPYNKAGNICLQAGTKVFTDSGPSDIYFKDLKIKNMDGL